MKYKFDFSSDKNLLLKATRGIGFEEVIEALENDKELDNFKHTNKKKYPSQRMFVVEVDNYAYVTPYVFNEATGIVFLKTIYPSARYTKRYLTNKQNMQKVKNKDPFKNLVLDEYEKEIEKSIEKGEFVRVNNYEETRKMFQEAAKNYKELQKTKRITLRVKHEDLIQVKAKAKQVNIPYQRLLNALIHKYAEGETSITI